MTAPAPAETTWRAVRCPCGKSVLADLRGAGDVEVRRHCPKCRGWWVIDVRTGSVRGSEPGE